ncbi:MAG: NUDIX domain-containing protein [Thermodesulfobacteriota bacterium]|nr:NUDIX domain-containing protein [Thermodesulfobacteriota bacterium]
MDKAESGNNKSQDADPIKVVAGILWREGSFLAAKRPLGKPLAGYWEFPGGKVEPGEDLGQALVRELDEELGLRPLKFSLFREKQHVYEHGTVLLYFFQVHAFKGLPRPREGHKLQWFTPGDTNGARFLEADMEIVNALKEPLDAG